MALPLFKEKRFSPRRKLTGLLPGRLIETESGNELRCSLVDVSQHGLGLKTKEEIRPGTTIILRMERQEIRLKVAWVQRDFGKQDLFRVGLLSCDPEVSVDDVFAEEGCLE